VAIVDENEEDDLVQAGVVAECDHNGCTVPYISDGDAVSLFATMNTADGPDTC